MFSGIIKCVGQVAEISTHGSSLKVKFNSSISGSLSVDQSVSHDGICLTVVETGQDYHIAQVVMETLSKTTFSNLHIGQYINLERSITPNTMLDGHFVQGHIDTTLVCLETEDLNGSWQFRFNLPEEYKGLVIPQGSICINGVSLTVAEISEEAFDVAIIPYTYEHTNFKFLKQGHLVNVEFDLIGKYIVRQMELRSLTE